MQPVPRSESRWLDPAPIYFLSRLGNTTNPCLLISLRRQRITNTNRLRKNFCMSKSTRLSTDSSLSCSTRGQSWLGCGQVRRGNYVLSRALIMSCCGDQTLNKLNYYSFWTQTIGRINFILYIIIVLLSDLNS